MVWRIKPSGEQEARQTEQASQTSEAYSSSPPPPSLPPIARRVKLPTAYRKYLWAFMVVGGLIMVGVFALQALRNSPSGSVSYEGKKTSITVANIGEYSIFNLIAKNKSLFEKHGLQAEIKEYTSGPPAVADLVTGKVDFAIAADFVGVSNIFSHKNLRILTQASLHDTFRIIARKDKGVTEPINLKGKKIGLTTDSAGEFFLGRFLTLNDLTLADISIVNLAPAEMISQLTAGQLDAVVIFEPHAYNLQKSLGDNAVSWSAQGIQKTYAVAYTTAAFIEANPDVVDRYVAALSEANDLLESSESEMRAFLATSLKYGADYVNYLWPKFDFGLGLSQELLLTMEDEARWSIEDGLTTEKAVPNYLENIYFDSLQKVKPDSINIIH